MFKNDEQPAFFVALHLASFLGPEEDYATIADVGREYKKKYGQLFYERTTFDLDTFFDEGYSPSEAFFQFAKDCNGKLGIRAKLAKEIDPPIVFYR